MTRSYRLAGALLVIVAVAVMTLIYLQFRGALTPSVQLTVLAPRAGLVRGGAGTALVGSHTEVADRIAVYAEVGIDEFIFSGYPHLEELFWLGEGVVPLLRERGLYAPDAKAVAKSSIPFVGATR